MRIRRPYVGRLTRLTVGAFAGLALVFTASPVWAGQLNLTGKTTITTVVQTQTNTFFDTVSDTAAQTVIGTIAGTGIGTVLLTAADTAIGTHLGTAIGTDLEIATFHSNIGLLNTLITTSTLTATVTDTVTTTAFKTITSTSTDTLFATGLFTGVETNIGTHTATITDTIFSTTTETVTFEGQPADVSIEITQEGLNLTSPFSNNLQTGAIINQVTVLDSSGITQVQANAGNANVTVGTNSIIDGPMLVAFAGLNRNSVALKELGVMTLVPGWAVQNSTKVTTAHIAGLALTAAEATATTVGENGTILTDTTTSGSDSTVDQEVSQSIDVIAVATAVDIIHRDINEYSPHDNNTVAAAIVRNLVNVTATTGVTQIQANAGSANVGGAHNLLLIDGTFRANGSGLNLNR